MIRMNSATAAIGLGLTMAGLLGGCGKKEPTPAPEVTPAPQAAVTPPAPEVAPTPAPPSTPAATPPESVPASVSSAESLMKKSDCFSCHKVDAKLVGPAYAWVAYRFKDDANAADKLAAAIKNGSAGQWTAYTGGIPMPPHPQLSDTDIKTMVKWVLSQTPVAPPKP
ncbi:c-type cytochrome [Sulfuriferula sp. GW1]|uniref:c-type cytochrome n=1 Tax=Sulfuriferula sp. GW1 TaxID=3345111 RepID=UPI0039AFF117